MTPTTSFKTLHSFVVNLDQEVTETTTRVENGQTITTATKVTKSVPHTVVMKEPSRRERQDLSLFQHVTYGEAINRGLLPKVTVQQKLGRDAQGSLSESEDKTVLAMHKRLQDLSSEYMLLHAVGDKATEEQTARKDKLLVEFMTLQRKAIDINEAYQSVYAYTAESYMQNKTLSWLALFLTYVKGADGKHEPLFAGADFAAREARAGDLEDAKDPLYEAVNAFDERVQMPKLSAYWGLYLFNRASKSEDFVAIEAEWTKQAAETEKVKEEAAAKGKVETPAAPPAVTEEGAAPVGFTPEQLAKVPTGPSDGTGYAMAISV